MDTLDLSLLAKALKPLAHQSRFLMLDEVDQALLARLAEAYEMPVVVDSVEPKLQSAPASLRQNPPAVPPSVPTLRKEVLNSPARPAVVETKPALAEPGGVEVPEPEIAVAPLNPWEAKSLDSLHVRVRNCTLCELSGSRRSVVFGQGNHNAFVMVVGDQPGQSEDQRGLAFFGETQLMLDRILYCLGLSRSAVFQTCLIKCRPDGDRSANPKEWSSCQPIFEKQVALLQPGLIIALGEAALKKLVPQAPSWAQARGQVFSYQEAGVIGIDSPHEVLSNQSKVPQLWDDLRRVRQELRKRLAR